MQKFEYISFHSPIVHLGEWLNKYAADGYTLCSHHALYPNSVSIGDAVIHYCVMERPIATPPVELDKIVTDKWAPARAQPIYLEVTDDKIRLAELQRSFGAAIPIEIAEMLCDDFGTLFHLRSAINSWLHRKYMRETASEPHYFKS
jgi:hypothetical protein